MEDKLFQKRYQDALDDVDIAVRNLDFLKDKLSRHRHDEFAPNVSDLRKITAMLKSIKKLSGDAILKF